MAENLGVAVLELTTVDKGFSRGLTNAETKARGFGSRLSGVASVAGKAGLLGALSALGVAVKIGINEFTESAKVTAQTEAVLKSTGGAANVTAKQVDHLATKIMNYSGIDDEAVKSGENLLLTFTNIRNEVGKGNDIFDQATKAAVDMSVALGTDVQSAALQVGKALNDPIRGLTVLQRAGVSFTKAQREQIKALVKSGHTMEAQKIILAELRKEFGGSAEAAGKTLPGQLAILRENFNNLAGKGVAVAIEKLQELRPTFEKLGKVISSLMPILKPLATLMFDVLVTPMKVVADLLTGDFAGAWEAVKKPIQDVLDLLGGVGEVFGGIAGKITGAAADAGTAATNFADGIWTNFTTAIGDIAGYVGGQITDAITNITNSLTSATTEATTFGGNILKGMKAGILGFANWVGGRVKAAISFVTDAAQTAYNEALAFGGKILSGLKDGILGFANWVGSRVGAAIGFLVDNAETAYNKAKEFGGKIFSGVKDGIKDLYDLVAGPLIRAVKWIGDAAEGAYNKAKALGGAIYRGLKEGLGALLSFLNSIISAIRWIEDHKPGPGARIPEIDPPGPPVGQPNASGGPVRAGDILSVGEFGRELFVPNVAGKIIPNWQLRAPAAAGSGPMKVVLQLDRYILGQIVIDDLARYQQNNGLPLLVRTA